MNTTFQPGDRDLLDQAGGMILVEWKEGLVKPPAGVAYGTHLVSLLVCPTGGEMKVMHLAWAYRDNSGNLYRTGQAFTGIDSLWFFKSETLHKFHYEPLSRSDFLFLQLDEICMDFSARLHPSQDEKVLQTRSVKELDLFRNQAFPDDVCAVIGQDQKIPDTEIELTGEQVWVRLKEFGPNETFAGELLNQPVNHPYKKGDKVYLRIIGKSSSKILCVVQPPKIKMKNQRPGYIEFIRTMYRDFFDIKAVGQFRGHLPDDTISVSASNAPGIPFSSMLPPMKDHKFDFEFTGGMPGTVECSFDQHTGRLLMMRLVVFLRSNGERDQLYHQLKREFIDQLEIQGVQRHPFVPVEALLTERLTVWVNHQTPEPILSVWLTVRDEYIKIITGNN